MPLSIVLIIAVLAIAAVAVLLHRLGFSRRARLIDAAQARALFEKENPGVAVDEAVLSGDGHTALLTIRGDDRHMGLIQTMGDGFMTRLLGPGQIARVDKVPDNALDITFTDFTYPRTIVNFMSNSSAIGGKSDALLYNQRLSRLIANDRPLTAPSGDHV